jgi:hypothetical protein
LAAAASATALPRRLFGFEAGAGFFVAEEIRADERREDVEDALSLRAESRVRERPGRFLSDVAGQSRKKAKLETGSGIMNKVF